MAAIATFVVLLSGDRLYEGLEARHVLLKDGAVILDARNWDAKGGLGQVTTDVIDLGGDALLGVPVRVEGLRVAVDAEAKPPAAVSTSIRTGSTYFQAPETWSDWVAVGDQALAVKGRYLQVRCTLTSTAPAALPAVRSVKVECQAVPTAEFKGRVTVAESNLQSIVRSTIPFAYERRDQADLVWLRQTFNLDKVIAGKKTEMEKLSALCEWVASRKNDRTRQWTTSHYPWNIRELLSEKDGGTIYGHCASYCAVFVTVAGSFGWQGRHVANEGFKRRSHEVPEVWVNDLGKWVYFDPSLDGLYLDAATAKPMGILEMHDVFLKYMYPGGLVQGSLDEDAQKAKNLAIDWSTFPVRYVSDLWWYGEKKQEPDFWHWGQGLMTCGYLQMTPRNNFHSQPRPYFTRFGHGPGSEASFHYWVDAQTPLRGRGIRNWNTRKRDWNWTLNQASLRLLRTAEDAVTVELGTSQPFFKRYTVLADGADAGAVTSPYVWRLKPGRNTLEVNGEDDFGTRGLPSKVTLQYAP